MKDYIKLLRINHYIKNLLIFVPIFFSGNLFNYTKFFMAVVGFICFCGISSAVYILNDLRDIENDRKHPSKCNRPLASKKISPKTAILLLVLCLNISLFFSLYMGNYFALFLLFLYFLTNFAYSIGLKNKPVIDVVILAFGFVIRIFYGGVCTNTPISKWLYLVITTGSLYMGLGKRRNELKRHTNTREVLKYYNAPFLDKNMYVCVTLANTFYALWTVEISDSKMSWTVPVFIIILMCYSLDTERDTDGDPVEVILHDKILISLIILYAICLFILLYVL